MTALMDTVAKPVDAKVKLVDTEAKLVDTEAKPVDTKAGIAKDKLDFIDALRGIACLSIFIYHLNSKLFSEVIPKPSPR